GAQVYPIGVSPWRFDVARNAALNLVPDDIDICLSVDLDEILQPGWVEAIQEKWRPGETTRIMYEYTWNFKPDGSPDTVFFTDKFHSRHDYIWRHPCHETLYYVGNGV